MCGECTCIYRIIIIIIIPSTCTCVYRPDWGMCIITYMYCMYMHISGKFVCIREGERERERLITVSIKISNQGILSNLDLSQPPKYSVNMLCLSPMDV